MTFEDLERLASHIAANETSEALDLLCREYPRLGIPASFRRVEAIRKAEPATKAS